MTSFSFNLGIVMPYSAGHEDNLHRSLAIFAQSVEWLPIVIIGDGVEPPVDLSTLQQGIGSWIRKEEMPKHQPGLEQPRNVGVRHLLETWPDRSHVWFIDCDMLVAPDAVEQYRRAMWVANSNAGVAHLKPESIFIGPYDWLPPGVHEPMPELRNDPRWGMFEERNLQPVAGELGTALGCFSGNLIWPIEEFIEVGGFHPQLHAGRCEDGELGLRAASHGIPITCVKEARAWHQYHDIDSMAILAKNARDVPLINEWHPWVETKGLVVSESDGARFEFQCPCGAQINTLEMWEHYASNHPGKAGAGRPPGPVGVPGTLILPDGLDVAYESWEQKFRRGQTEAVEDHIRAIVEDHHWPIDELAQFTGMTPEFIQEQLERSQFRSHEG